MTSLPIARSRGVSLRTALLADENAAVAPIFGLSMIAILVAAGVAVDYSRATDIQSRIQMAADAAALDGARVASDKLSQGENEQTARTAGRDKAIAMFRSHAQASDIQVSELSAEADVSLSAGTVSVDVRARATVPTAFMKMAGIPSVAVNRHSQATIGTANEYINFHVVIDTSNSMGLAASPAEMQRLYDWTVAGGYSMDAQAGCVFACHARPWNKPMTFLQYARSATPPVRLRIDAARDAVRQLIDDALVNAPAGNVATTRFALYSASNTITERMPPTNQADRLRARVAEIDLIESNMSGPPETDLTAVLNELYRRLPPGGDGANPGQAKQVVILVTDGLNDVPCYGTHCASVMSRAPCDQLKTKAQIGVVYLTYHPIYNENRQALGYTYQYQDHVAPRATAIKPALQACASSADLFSEAEHEPHVLPALTSVFRSARIGGSKLRLAR